MPWRGLATSCLNKRLDLGEHGSGLLVHADAPHRFSTGASGHVGSEHLITYHETVRPGLRGGAGVWGLLMRCFTGTGFLICDRRRVP